MNHRAEYLLQVLEKIGSPLLTAVIDVQAVNPPQQGLHNEAQRLAELIARTVQTSIELGSSIDLGPSGTMTDSVRIGLTGLASPVVAAAYRNTGRAPAEADIKRLVSALQAVLSFAENFDADDDHTGRLKHSAANGAVVDNVQGQIQYFHAFVPVIHAISQFSFGQPEQKFITDVAGRLTARASALRAQLFPSADPGDRARIERGLLKALAEIYAAAHLAETTRILGMSEAERAAMTGGMSSGINEVWNGFETRVAMLAALAQGMAGISTDTQQAGGSPAPVTMTPPPASAPVVQPPVSTTSQAAAASPLASFAKKPAGDPAPPAASTPPASTGTNPMSFFKAPPKTEE